MPETGSKVAKWDDWSKGDYGTDGGRKSGAGTFTGTNVVVYANGGVGPRPGLLNVTPASMPTGKLLALAKSPIVGRDGLFVIGNTVYRFDLGTAATAPTAVGTFDTTPTEPLYFYLNTDVFYVALPGDKCYRVDPTNDQVDAVTDSPPGRFLIIHNGQMLVAGDGSDDENREWRIRASKPGDVNDWSEGRSADVGTEGPQLPAWQITAMGTQRNGLAVLKREEAFVITGIIGDPDSQVIRRATGGTTTLQPWHAQVDDADRFWHIPVFRDNIAAYTGGGITQEFNLEFSVNEHDEGDTLPLLQGLAVTQGDQTGSTVVAVRGGDSQEALVLMNNAWTRQAFDVDISGMVAADRQGRQGLVVFTDGGDTGVAAKIYTADFNTDRPGFTTDPLSRPGDDSDTPLVSNVVAPQFWTEAGREIKVRQVVVDFDVWDTGSATHNHFDVSVKVLGRDANRGVNAEEQYTTEDATAPNAYDEDTNASSASGTAKRQVFNFNCDWGAGCEVSTYKVQGASIQAFTIMYSERASTRPMS